jgi:predicted PurR-regulated permease PerM
MTGPVRHDLNDPVARARWLALLAATGIAALLCWRMMQPFVEVIAWAAVLAIVFFPAYRGIRTWVRRPNPAAVLAVFLVVVTVLAPLLFVTSAVVNELHGMTQSIQAEFQRLRSDPQAAAKLQQGLDRIKGTIDLESVLSDENVSAFATRASQFLLERSAGLVGSLLSILVSIGFTIFTLFYLFRDGEALVAKLPGMLPLDRARAHSLLHRAHEIISASVYGVVIIAIIQGALGGIMFAILGLPSPIVWGVVMTVLSTIPMLGSGIVWGPAAVVLGVTGQWGKMAVLTLWGALVIGTIDNFLRPRLVGKRTRMHDLLVFFSVLGGLAAFGLIGLLLGPVVLGIAMVLFEATFGDATGAGAGTEPSVTASRKAG